MSNKLRSLKTGIKWATLSIAGLISAKIVRGIFIPKLLDPMSYGLFTSIGLFTRYLQFADFGVQANFIKQLPHIHFNENIDRGKTLIDRSFSLICISFLLIVLYLGIASYISAGASSTFYKNALLLLIPVCIFSKLRGFYISYHLGIQDYKFTSVTTLVNVYAHIILDITGIYFYGALGGIVGMLIAELSTFLYIKNISALKPKFLFNKSILCQWKDSAKQFFVSISELLASTIDQFFILIFFDLKGYGYYALGLMFAWSMEAGVSIFNDTSYPKIVTYAKDNPEKAKSLFNNMIFCYIILCTFMLPMAIYTIEVIIKFYFPEYSVGLSVYALMLFLGVARGVMTLVRRMYIAMDKEQKYIAYSLIAVILNLITLTLLMLTGANYEKMITAIVILNLISCAIFYSLLISNRDILFWKNVSLAFIGFIFTVVYKYMFRKETFVFLEMNIAFIYLCIGTLAAGLFAYTERKYLKKSFQ